MRWVGVISDRGWSREFDDPIALPGGRMLRTLRDAATYITGLPKKEAAMPEWQAAIESLILVADLGGPTMSACSIPRAKTITGERESFRRDR